jgi:hypothetical protein
MKTATMPALRVDPQLREAVESVLNDAETRSSAVKVNVTRRQHQQAFIARGLASSALAKQNQVYYSAEAVLAELQSGLNQ